MLTQVRCASLVALGLTLAVSSACRDDDANAPARDALRQPTGLALLADGRWLLVTNGNWDREESHGTLLGIDLASVHESLASGDDRRCPEDPDGVRQCRASAFIDAASTVSMGSGLGNIAVDEPRGAVGREHERLAAALGLRPLLDLSLGDGEGAGAALAAGIVRNAALAHSGMALRPE